MRSEDYVMANGSVLAMQNVKDKSQEAAVLSFINMGFATIAVFSFSFFSLKPLLLPLIYLVLTPTMFLLLRRKSFNDTELKKCP